MRWSSAPDIQAPVRLPWMTDASCARPGVDPEIFFVLALHGSDAAAYAPALAVCAACPVRAECLALATSTPSIGHGVWGGLTPEQMRTASKRARR